MRTTALGTKGMTKQLIMIGAVLGALVAIKGFQLAEAWDLRHSRIVSPVSLWKMVLKNATESYPQKDGISSMGILPLLRSVIAFSIRLF